MKKQQRHQKQRRHKKKRKIKRKIMNIKVKKSKSKKKVKKSKSTQEEDIFNLIIGQEIGNQKDEVKGGDDNDLYNYSSSNEDELFKSVKKKYKGKRKR